MGNERLTFGQWLAIQLEHLEMKPADLARAAHVGTNTVSYWLRGIRVPDSTSCPKIADALRLHVRAVLIAAGHLPPNEGESLTIYEISRSINEAKTQYDLVEAQVREELTGRKVRVALGPRLPASNNCWQETMQRQETVDVSIMELDGRSPESVFAVVASGEHLRSKEIFDGRRVLCERLPSGALPENDDVAVVRYREQYLLRVWFRDGDWVELRDSDGRVLERFSIADEFEPIGVAFHVMGHALR